MILAGLHPFSTSLGTEQVGDYPHSDVTHRLRERSPVGMSAGGASKCSSHLRFRVSIIRLPPRSCSSEKRARCNPPNTEHGHQWRRPQADFQLIFWSVSGFHSRSRSASMAPRSRDWEGTKCPLPGYLKADAGGVDWSAWVAINPPEAVVSLSMVTWPCDFFQPMAISIDPGRHGLRLPTESYN